MPSIREFLSELETIPWFARIGCELEGEMNVERIWTWEEWPGPEQSEVLEISLRHQTFFESFACETGKLDTARRTIWDEAHDRVFRSAPSAIPYDASQDAWHGPTTAVWQAAWTAGLIALFLHEERVIPKDLLEQWKWFERGHWPAQYVRPRADGDFCKLVIY